MMLKKLVRVLLLLLAGAAVGRLLPVPQRLWRIGGEGVDATAPAGTASAVIHSPPAPTLRQVRDLSSLVTSVAEVSDVQMTRLAGRTGGVEAALLVRGDVEVSVDLGLARFERLDPAARRAVLVLPPPRTSRPRLDHGRTRLLWLGRSGLWALVPAGAGGGAAEARVVEESHRRAQAVVEAAAGDPQLLERSRRQAERVLRVFFDAAGWDVDVRWSEEAR
jgi:hypothetical protein